MHSIKTKYVQFLLLGLVLLGTSVVLNAQAEIPPKPEKETSVYDGAGLLSGYEKNTLEQKLIKYADSTSTQIVVATVQTIHGEDIAFYATKWAQEWGLGQAKEDNGVFVLVAKDDRKLTIQTGYGIEHLLTDALSKRIITNIITPQFKQGNFYGGLDRGTSAIIEVLNGEYQENRNFNNNGSSGIPFIFIILFFVVLIIILSSRNKGRGNRGGRRRRDSVAGSILEAIILSKAGRGGFGGGGGFGGSSGGGSFGGGGFGGGFGGGGFGGGGASGGW
jgi:uncharacterized protein